MSKGNERGMTTKIVLDAMRFHAFHGVMPHEKQVGNEFEVTLTLEVDVTAAIESDRLADTINYADLYGLVKAEMVIPSELIEHVGGRILKRVKAEYPSVSRLEVRVAKLHPPVEGAMKSAEVVLTL
ncbi:MAG: dihydroneopterin aldolase [Fermentimonas sp.]